MKDLHAMWSWCNSILSVVPPVLGDEAADGLVQDGLTAARRENAEYL